MARSLGLHSQDREAKVGDPNFLLGSFFREMAQRGLCQIQVSQH